jgi:hypothetical protein
MSKTLEETLKAIRVRDISGKLFPISESSAKDAFHKAID